MGQGLLARPARLLTGLVAVCRGARRACPECNRRGGLRPAPPFGRTGGQRILPAPWSVCKFQWRPAPAVGSACQASTWANACKVVQLDERSCRGLEPSDLAHSPSHFDVGSTLADV